MAASIMGEILPAAALRLRQVSDSPRLDAELLLAHVLNRERSLVISHGDQALSPEDSERFEQLLLRRAAGVPLAYLTGGKEFWSLRLNVTPDVLIPRPETELLVEWALECLKDLVAPRIADLGTGSGCIALALAHERPDAMIFASDVSSAALVVAASNAQRLNIANIEFNQGSWFSPHASRPAYYDLVVSNPPYVAENDLHLAKLAYEPKEALTAGADGLADLRCIAESASGFLRSGGWLLLEHGAEQGAAVRKLLYQSGFEAVETRCDLAGLDRATGGQRP